MAVTPSEKEFEVAEACLADAKLLLHSGESAKLLSKAYKLREESDYDVFAPIDPEDVRRLLSQSEKFLDEMKALLASRQKR